MTIAVMKFVKHDYQVFHIIEGTSAARHQTMYRCTVCKEAVCPRHQNAHAKECWPLAIIDPKEPK